MKETWPKKIPYDPELDGSSPKSHLITIKQEILTKVSRLDNKQYYYFINVNFLILITASGLWKRISK